MKPTAVIYEGTPGDRLKTSMLTVVGAQAEDLVDEALRLAEDGWTRLELCGGVGIDVADKVRAALPGEVRIGLNRYGFESLELVAEYKQAFARGEVRPSVFLVPSEAGSARVDHSDVSIVPVSSTEQIEAMTSDLVGLGVGLIELYGGLGTAHAAAAVRGAHGRAPVGFVGYDD